LFAGKSIHTTELLESPLEPENHILFKAFSRVYIDIEHLQMHSKELASYDISEIKILKNIERFIDLLNEEKLYAQE